jgi:Protein of unknown function (DUF3011)
MRILRNGSGLLVVALVIGAAAPAAAQTDEELRCQAVARTLLGDESVRIVGRSALPFGEAVVNWRSASGDAGTCSVDASGRMESVFVEQRGGVAVDGGSSTGPAGGGDWEPFSVTCSSSKDRRTECQIPAGSRVRLEEQLSRSDCVAGTSWGAFGQVLWVDRGCRAIFRLTPAPSWPEYTLNCWSDGGRRRECAIKEGGVAQLASTLSKTPCNEGTTWGQDEERVWVDKGCRASFRVAPAVGGGLVGVAADPQTVSLQAREACSRQVEALGLSVAEVTGSTPAADGGYQVEMRLARRGGLVDATCLWNPRSGQALLSVH